MLRLRTLEVFPKQRLRTYVDHYHNYLCDFDDENEDVDLQDSWLVGLLG